MIHEFKNEGKRVFLSGINSNERHKTLVVVAEVAACQRFIVQPLPETFSEQSTRVRGYWSLTE